jgi:hypothetical protein
MYQTDITDYGNQIKTYFEKAFNDSQVSNGCVKLVVDQAADTDWQAVYNDWMMKGRFDLAFGAISGNTYNPLNFLEVLKSDNSSGFTLNWGTDTSKVDTKNPIIFDGRRWSYDALWEVSNSGGVVENGVGVKTVKNYYLEGLPKTIATSAQTNDYSEGVTQDVKLEFVNLDGVEINITKVQVYPVGGVNRNVSNYTYDKNSKNLRITISSADGASIKEELKTINNKTLTPEDPGYIASPFTNSQYGKLWTFEVYYSLSIRGGTPSENYITLVLSQDDQN